MTICDHFLQECGPLISEQPKFPIIWVYCQTHLTFLLRLCYPPEHAVPPASCAIRPALSYRETQVSGTV